MRPAKAWAGIRFNEHMEGDGETVFWHACKFGLEGSLEAETIRPTATAARATGSRFKTPEAPAVKREAEENWG